MKLKLNLPVPKSSSAIKYYEKLFTGLIIKDGKNDGHAYINIYNKLSLHIHSTGKISQNKAYFIIRFERNERNIYIQTIQRISEMVDIELKVNSEEMIWGTTVTEFKDRYGYQWVLEIDTQ